MEVRLFHEDGILYGAPKGSWILAVLVRGKHANHQTRRRPGLSLEEKGRCMELGLGGSNSPPKAIALDLNLKRRHDGGGKPPLTAKQVRNSNYKQRRAKKARKAQLAVQRVRFKRPGSAFEYDAVLVAAASHTRVPGIPAAALGNIVRLLWVRTLLFVCR